MADRLLRVGRHDIKVTHGDRVWKGFAAHKRSLTAAKKWLAVV